MIIKPVTITASKNLKLNSGSFLAIGFPCYKKKKKINEIKPDHYYSSFLAKYLKIV